jgi:hypothetical protein
MDPWHDHLALPVAPLVLLAQVIALFVRPWWVRLLLAFGCTAAIAAMFAYVASLDVSPDEGVNIGAGVLALWFGLSFLLLLAEVGREAIAKLWRGFDGTATPPG